MDRSGVAAAFAVAFAEGSRRWPEVCLTAESFERYLQGVLGSAPAPEWERHAADLYLCCGCLHGNVNAQRILEKEFFPALLKPLARLGARDDSLREILQTLRTRLLVGPPPRLRAYSGRGPLPAWLKVTATRLALDALRASGRLSHWEDNLASVAAPESDPFAALLKARYGQAFQQALQDALQALGERDRHLLRLRLVDGCSIDRLGCIFQVDRATAARWLNGARERVFRRVREQLSGSQQLTVQEFQSLARLVMSQLELRPSAFAEPASSASAALPCPGGGSKGAP